MDSSRTIKQLLGFDLAEGDIETAVCSFFKQKNFYKKETEHRNEPKVLILKFHFDDGDLIEIKYIQDYPGKDQFTIRIRSNKTIYGECFKLKDSISVLEATFRVLTNKKEIDDKSSGNIFLIKRLLGLK